MFPVAVKVINLKIAILVDLVMPVVTGGNSKQHRYQSSAGIEPYYQMRTLILDDVAKHWHMFHDICFKLFPSIISSHGYGMGKIVVKLRPKKPNSNKTKQNKAGKGKV